jgi:hypothetical protein
MYIYGTGCCKKTIHSWETKMSMAFKVLHQEPRNSNETALLSKFEAKQIVVSENEFINILILAFQELVGLLNTLYYTIQGVYKKVLNMQTKKGMQCIHKLNLFADTMHIMPVNIIVLFLLIIISY